MATRKPAPTVKPDDFYPRDLTPQEIVSLRKDAQEAGERAGQIFEQMKAEGHPLFTPERPEKVVRKRTPPRIKPRK